MYNYPPPENQQQNGQPFNASPYMQPDPVLGESSTGLSPGTAGSLAYAFIWVSGLILVLIEHKNRFVAFHAWQSLLFFGFFSLLYTFIPAIFGFLPYSFFYTLGIIEPALLLFLVVMWIVLVVNAYQGRYFKLPVIGDIAEARVHSYPR